MLRLSLPALGMTAGCNYAVADVLLTHIAGLATVFYDAGDEPRDRFGGILKKHYP
jgi:hypothetical protein